MKSNAKIFEWPTGSKFMVILLWTIYSTVAFTAIYGLCNHYASLNPKLYQMYTQWELEIPLVPVMIYPYLSLNLLFLMSAFVLKEITSIKAFCSSLIVGALFAGIFFYFFPGELGFIRTSVPGYDAIFNFMFQIDKPHNLYPSLHVTYSTLAVLAMIEQTKSKSFHSFLIIWLVLIIISVVLVHQHHLFDIVTGFILALLLNKLIYSKIHKTKKA